MKRFSVNWSSSSESHFSSVITDESSAMIQITVQKSRSNFEGSASFGFFQMFDAKTIFFAHQFEIMKSKPPIFFVPKPLEVIMDTSFHSGPEFQGYSFGILWLHVLQVRLDQLNRPFFCNFLKNFFFNFLKKLFFSNFMKKDS